MSQEFDSKETLGLRDLRNFRLAVDKIKYTPGSNIDLVNKVDDLNGSGKTYSQLLPHEGVEKLNRILDTLILELVPSGESRQTLEDGFNAGPEKKIKGDHGDTHSTEWQTIHDNVVIGIRAVRDQRGESERSWYLRNTAKKPGLLSFLKL